MFRRLPLAPWTVEAGALALAQAADRGCATTAWKPLTVVHPAAELEIAGFTIASDKVAYRASTSFNGAIQCIPDRLHKSGTTLARHSARDALGMNACMVQGFVCIDVSDARNNVRIHQELFDWRFLSTAGLEQVVTGECIRQRFETEPFQQRVSIDRAIYPQHSPETPWIRQANVHTVFQDDVHMVMLSRLKWMIEYAQAARHSQMDQQVPAFLSVAAIEQQVFPTARDIEHRLARKALGQKVRNLPAQTLFAYDQRTYFLPLEAGQKAEASRFHFGKFGHGERES